MKMGSSHSKLNYYSGGLIQDLKRGGDTVATPTFGGPP